MIEELGPSAQEPQLENLLLKVAIASNSQGAKRALLEVGGN